MKSHNNLVLFWPMRRPVRHLMLALILSAGCDCGDGALGVLTPDVDATPSPLAFGTAFLGIGSTKQLTVQNRGTAPLTVTGLRLADDTHPDVSLGATEGFELAPGEARMVSVAFVPLTVGPAFGAVLIDSDDPDEPTLEVPIEGSGERRPGPVISVEPARIDFGPVDFGTTAEATITIRSVGTEPLMIADASPEAGAHPSIGFDPSSYTGTLQVDEAQVITVRFTPTVPEEVTAVFRIQSNDPELSSVPVIVTGRGTAPTLCLSEAVLDFGQVAIGEFAERTVTLESCGAVPFDLTALDVVGSTEFSVQMAPGLPLTLAVGETTDVTVRYTPVDPGQDMDQLRIQSTLPDGFVTLIGRSAACDLVVTPTAVNFNAVGTGGSRARNVLLENPGGVECLVTGLSFGAGTSSEFSLTTPPALPHTLPPGGSLTVEVTYAPTDTGSDSGTLEIANSDPAEPVISVSLDGRRLGPGDCALIVTPDPIAFGAVQLGTTQTISVTLENDGTSLCNVSQTLLGAGSSRDFDIVPLTFPTLIPAGQTTSMDVMFTPRSTAAQSATLEIFTGLIPLTPDFIIPISGAGSGAELCVTPEPLVFGTHMIGQPVPRTLTLSACGTESVVISALTLVAPTSTEYSLPTPPSLPLTIVAGGVTTVDVSFAGVDEGREDGVLRIDSNDALRPARDVELIAHASNGPCGDIQGKLCDLAGSGPVAGGTVYVDTPGGRIQTTTNAQGDWVLTCVPIGSWQVHAEQGSWTTQFPASVSANSVTTLPGQQCLDPNSASVAVVWGQWDQMETILTDIGIPYTFYDQNQAGLLVNDASELALYDVVFLNCGWDEGIGLVNPGRTNLINYVNGGGSLYASDWGYDVLEVAWPPFVDYLGDDTVRDAAQSAGNFSGLVDVVDPSLQAALAGKTQVHIESCCTAVDSAGAGTSVYLSGDRLQNGGTNPLMVGFTPQMNAGKVFYTDFHNTGQADIRDIFNWLILQL